MILLLLLILLHEGVIRADDSAVFWTILLSGLAIFGNGTWRVWMRYKDNHPRIQITIRQQFLCVDIRTYYLSGARPVIFRNKVHLLMHGKWEPHEMTINSKNPNEPLFPNGTAHCLVSYASDDDLPDDLYYGPEGVRMVDANGRIYYSDNVSRKHKEKRMRWFVKRKV